MRPYTSVKFDLVASLLFLSYYFVICEFSVEHLFLLIPPGDVVPMKTSAKVFGFWSSG